METVNSTVPEAATRMIEYEMKILGEFIDIRQAHRSL
jgi:hypothetical protein